MWRVTFYQGNELVIDHSQAEVQMSYHYALEYWDLFHCPEYDICPVPYDGHSPEDVIQRLQQI